MVLENLPARMAKLFSVLLETLLDGPVTIRQLFSAKPRRIARTSAPLLRRAGLCLCIAAVENQDRNCQKDNPAHSFLLASKERLGS